MAVAVEEEQLAGSASPRRRDEEFDLGHESSDDSEEDVAEEEIAASESSPAAAAPQSATIDSEGDDAVMAMLRVAVAPASTLAQQAAARHQVSRVSELANDQLPPSKRRRTAEPTTVEQAAVEADRAYAEQLQAEEEPRSRRLRPTRPTHSQASPSAATAASSSAGAAAAAASSSVAVASSHSSSRHVPQSDAATLKEVPDAARTKLFHYPSDDDDSEDRSGPGGAAPAIRKTRKKCFFLDGTKVDLPVPADYSHLICDRCSKRIEIKRQTEGADGWPLQLPADPVFRCPTHEKDALTASAS